MNERILLSTFIIKILDKNKNEQVLSHFNGQEDFLGLFYKFTDEILQNIEKQQDLRNRTTLHLTMEKPGVLKSSERYLYGSFSSGVSGERFDVKNIGTNTTELEVDPIKHASFRNVFFYCYIPKGKSVGYLILQRKSKFGVKILLKQVLNKFIHEHGYTNYNIEINNLLHIKVYEKMMKKGKLKKIDLIKRRIPNTIDELLKNNGNTLNTKGTLRTSISTSSSLSDYWKTFADYLYRNHNDKTKIEIDGSNGEIDEIEFELELNGKKKTFYINNHQRIQPDIDVTANLEFENNEPKVESLIKESQSLINDMLEIK